MPNRFTCIALLIGLLSLPAQAQSRHARHVRVILDTSKSMRKNDQSRLAVLSTLLLHDLVRPELPRDSFRVVPFHPTNKWENAADPIPTQTGSVIERKTVRDNFAEKLQAQRYDAKWTYYYPGLLMAIEELSAYKGKDDVRVIVIVTDGLPEKDTRQAELQRIRNDLLGRMGSAQIRHYILAFGKEATANPDFFRQLIPASGGDLWMDPSGESLLPNMAQLFSRSFGYTVDIPAKRTYPGVDRLDLAGGSMTPAEAAALMFWNKHQAPQLDLTHSTGAVNTAHWWQGAERGDAGKAASYALRWVVNPEQGGYDLTSNAPGATVAVLRPALISIQVVAPAAPPDAQTYQTIARMKFPLRVLLMPNTGGGGDPGHFEVTFQPLGERVHDAEAPENKFSYEGRKGGPLPGDLGTVTSQGRAYSIFPEFNQPADDQEYYVGHLRIEARKNGVLTASTVHPVLVYPHLEISPIPREEDARLSGGSSTALEKNERGCAEFSFQLQGESPRLPHPDRPEYVVRAFLESALPSGIQEGEVTLDGDTLQVEASATRPGKWQRGILLSAEGLLGTHEVCVVAGKPAALQPNQILDLPVAFRLDETPYRQFDVIRGFTLHVKLAPPGPEDILFEYFPLLLLLLIPMAMWYLRPRPTLPNDLAFRLGPDRLQAEQQTLSLGPPPIFRRLLGLRGMHPVCADAQSEPLGWVRPENELLYSFRPAKEVQLSGAGDEPVSASRRQAMLQVGTDYRLQRAGRSFAFRLEYR